MQPQDITDRYIVIVEGKADRVVFERLCRESAIGSIDFLCPEESFHGGFGKDFFYRVLEGLPLMAGFRQAKGIVMIQDSDESCDSVLKDVAGQVKKANKALEKQDQSYGIPDAFLTPAMGIETPPTMVLSVPWIDEIGAIETLLLASVENKFPDIKECVDGFVACSGGLIDWPTAKVAKMRLSCCVSAINKKDPTASIPNMLSCTEFDGILAYESFDNLRNFFSEIDDYF